MRSWIERDPKSLADARLQLHWACQTVAATGRTWGEHEQDDSHTNMGWSERDGALVGHPTATSLPFRVGVRLADATLLVLPAEGEKAAFALAGRTLDEAYAWLAEAAAAHDPGLAGVEIDRPDYEMPGHGVARGEPFSLGDRAAFEEMAGWYSAAAALLDGMRNALPGASAVRCWPHHFDIATLLTLDPEAGSEDARSVGLGMTPGDGAYPEPYFYVTPWPYPEDPKLPELPHGGRWHTEGWTGAVLTGSALAAGGPDAEQAERASRFLEAAASACRGLLR